MNSLSKKLSRILACRSAILFGVLGTVAGPAFAACSPTRVGVEVEPIEVKKMKDRYNADTLTEVRAACQKQIADFIRNRFPHWTFVEAPEKADIYMRFSVVKESNIEIRLRAQLTDGVRKPLEWPSRVWVWYGLKREYPEALQDYPSGADLERELCNGFIDGLIKVKSDKQSVDVYDLSPSGSNLKTYVPLGRGARWLNQKGRQPLEIALPLSDADCHDLRYSLFKLPAREAGSPIAAVKLYSLRSGIAGDKLVVHPCSVSWPPPKEAESITRGDDRGDVRALVLDDVRLQRYYDPTIVDDPPWTTPGC